MGFASTALSFGKKVATNLSKGDSPGDSGKSQLKDIGETVKKGLKKYNSGKS